MRNTQTNPKFIDYKDYKSKDFFVLGGTSFHSICKFKNLHHGVSFLYILSFEK